jgi:hypothetical protein
MKISKNVSSILNWYKHTKTEKYPNNFPKAPRSAYKKEWKGWPDFLGTSTKPRSRKS